MLLQISRQRWRTWKGITEIESSPVSPCPIESDSSESSCLPDLCLPPETSFPMLKGNKAINYRLNRGRKLSNNNEYLNYNMWEKESKFGDEPEIEGLNWGSQQWRINNRKLKQQEDQDLLWSSSTSKLLIWLSF